MTSLEICYAARAGKSAALDYWTRKQSWPLAPRPQNPFFAKALTDQTEEHDQRMQAWQDEFNETMKRLDA